MPDHRQPVLVNTFLQRQEIESHAHVSRLRGSFGGHHQLVARIRYAPSALAHTTRIIAQGRHTCFHKRGFDSLHHLHVHVPATRRVGMEQHDPGVRRAVSEGKNAALKLWGFLGLARGAAGEGNVAGVGWVHGRWTMDDGRWTMDDGRWTMDDRD